MTRRSRLAVYAVLAAAVALLPVTAMHILAGRRARQRGEAELARTADAVLERAELIFSRTEESLKTLQPGVDASCPEHTIANLRRAVFRDRYIREVGVVDASGRLVCTSWGPVAAPPVISEALRRPAGAPGLAVRGPARTAIMGDPSLILSLPLAGGGEVNALVDPEELVFTAKDSGLGSPGGGLAASSADGSILAALGPGGARRRRRVHARALVAALRPSRRGHGAARMAHALVGT